MNVFHPRNGFSHIVRDFKLTAKENVYKLSSAIVDDSLLQTQHDMIPYSIMTNPFPMNRLVNSARANDRPRNHPDLYFELGNNFWLSDRHIFAGRTIARSSWPPRSIFTGAATSEKMVPG